MAIDAGIYNALLGPVRSAGDWADVYADREDKRAMRETQRTMNALQLQQAQQAMQDDAAQRNALTGLAPNATAAERAAKLRSIPSPKAWSAADALETADLTRRKSAAEVGKLETEQAKAKRADLIQQVASLQTPDDALQLLNGYVTAGQLGMREATAFQSLIQKDPQWQFKLVMSIADPSKMLELLKPHMQTVNAGNAQVQQMVDPITGKVTETGRTQIFQSPDSAASTGLGYARLNEDKRHNNVSEGLAERHFQAAQSGTGNATEDERKAAGWLSQAENAWKNMQGVAFGDVGPNGKRSIKDAARPGALEQAMWFSDTARNVARSPERQQFVQAASSLSEAMLRAATGAGVNKDEAQQKVTELTPQWGDSEDVVRQKFDSIPKYIQSLKSRAGRAIPRQPNAQPGGGEVDFRSLK